MPYTHITRTSFGADAIRYARGNGKGHDGTENRNMLVCAANMLPDNVVPFEQQMQKYWDKASSRHKTQINRIILSFSKDELPPDDPQSYTTAAAIARDVHDKIAPDCQAAFFVQRDGKGGCVHVHYLLSDVRMTDCKGVDRSAYWQAHVSKVVDEMAGKYIDLDTSKPMPERVNQAVRGKRDYNEKVRAENEHEVALAKEQGTAVDASKIKPEKYIWQDDLRGRIRAAAEGAKNEADFAHRLRLSGVELVPSKTDSTSYLHPATKKQPAHYMYELVDISGFDGKVPPNLRSKSFKLGDDFQPDTLSKSFTYPSRSAQQTVQSTPSHMDDDTYPQRHRHATNQQKPSQQPQQRPRQQPKSEMENAEDTALSYFSHAYAMSQGWIGTPTDKYGMTDFDELSKRRRKTEMEWDRFRSAEGTALQTVYERDKIYQGSITVDRDALLSRVNKYLHPAPAQSPVQSQASTPMTPIQGTEQPRQTKPTKPTNAADQRVRLTAHLLALDEELRRTEAEIENTGYGLGE